MKIESRLKILTNEIFFGIVSFFIAVLVLTFTRFIDPVPEHYFLGLIFHLVEIIIVVSVVKKIVHHVPSVFDEPFVRDTTLVSAAVLLLVDWEKLNVLTKNASFK